MPLRLSRGCFRAKSVFTGLVQTVKIEIHIFFQVVLLATDRANMGTRLEHSSLAHKPVLLQRILWSRFGKESP